MSAEKVAYKAVLFDLDGVLVDMREAHFEALNTALSLFGTKIGDEEHHAFFNGLPSRKKLLALEEQCRVQYELIEFINEIKQLYTREIIPNVCLPNPEKIEMLLQLKQAGIKVGCCSNSMQEMVHLMLESSQLFEHFDVLIGNDSVSKPKPDPEMYIDAMRRLGVSPNETIIVEDSTYGIEAARASGATVYVVKGTEDVHIGLFGDILSL